MTIIRITVVSVILNSDCHNSETAGNSTFPYYILYIAFNLYKHIQHWKAPEEKGFKDIL